MAKKLVLIVLAFLLIATSAQAGCDDKAKLDAAHDRSWVKSDKVIIYKQDKKIYKMAFNASDASVVASPGFAYLESDLALSADGRYAVYGGWQSATQYAAYAFDTTLNTEFKLPVNLPEQGRGRSTPKFSFSPDGKSIAWVEDAAFKGAVDFTVMTLGTKATATVPFPAEAQKLQDYRATDIKWSADGSALYLGLVAYPMGAYFRYDIGASKLTKIDGAYLGYHGDPAKSGMHFYENGKEPALFGQTCLQWQCSGQGKAADGESVAIDKDDQLVLTTPDGKSVVVDKGSENQCEGVTIRALSWLEGGKYLVYALKGAVYIYGVDEGRKAILFDSLPQFAWGDTEKRTSSPF
jgi:hypothetical protein